MAYVFSLGMITHFLELYNILLSTLFQMAPIRSLTHVFAMVKWAKPHNQHHWFGQSATVCEEPSISCYIPFQRILGIRAHANLEVQFNDSKEILYASVLMQTLKCNLMTLRKYYMYLSRPLVLCKRNF